MPSPSLIERDLQHIWHPCAQMKDYRLFPPLEIVRAKDCYIELKNGKKIIDAIASWWCKSLGHGHPRLKAALTQQIEKFEHVMLAHTTNDTIVTLSEQLAGLTKTLNKICYASDGSCTVEMALKMSLHTRVLQGDKNRNQFIALENSYHGETLGALSVSDLGIYRDPYTALLFKTHFLTNLPYVTSIFDPLWQNCAAHWSSLEKALNQHADTTTAIIIEPILQGAGGMLLISQDFFQRLRRWSTQHNIHLIADEILTGIGRTCHMLACEHAGIEPDFLCLSKSLTAGWLPLSAMLTTQTIYDHFYADHFMQKAFLHSHTHTGNALAASVALAALHVIKEDNLCARANHIGRIMYENMQEIKSETGLLDNIRYIGAVVAADMTGFDAISRPGFTLYQKAAELGALIRPIGHTLYWLPPLTIDTEDLARLKEITQQALLSVASSNSKPAPKESRGLNL